jgi:hypothetical protein
VKCMTRQKNRSYRMSCECAADPKPFFLQPFGRKVAARIPDNMGDPNDRVRLPDRRYCPECKVQNAARGIRS